MRLQSSFDFAYQSSTFSFAFKIPLIDNCEKIHAYVVTKKPLAPTVGRVADNSGAFARASQQSTMGNKIWLSMHPRNFGLTKPSVRTYIQPLMITNVKSHTSYESKAYTICV